MYAAGVPGSPPRIFRVNVEALLIRPSSERTFCKRFSATSVLMSSSRPRVTATSAELIFPMDLVMRFCASVIVVTDEAAFFSMSAFRISAAFFS